MAKKTKHKTQYCKTTKTLKMVHIKKKKRKKEKKIPRDKQKHSIPKRLGCSKSNIKRAVYSNTPFYLKRSQSNNVTLYIKRPEPQIKLKVHWRNEMIKIGTEISKWIQKKILKSQQNCYGLNICVLQKIYIDDIQAPKDDGIRRWGFWEVLKSWGWNPHEWN